MVEPDKRFTNFGVCHEHYIAGHLIQAAIVHLNATLKTDFFNVACRLADYFVDIFGPRKFETIDGHAGVEMALINLYRITNNIRYLDLAKFFIEQRGSHNSRLKWELAHLDEILAELMGGIVTIEGKGLRPGLSNWEGKLYQTENTVNPDMPTLVKAIPYYC